MSMQRIVAYPCRTYARQLRLAMKNSDVLLTKVKIAIKPAIKWKTRNQYKTGSTGQQQPSSSCETVVVINFCFIALEGAGKTDCLLLPGLYFMVFRSLTGCGCCFVLLGLSGVVSSNHDGFLLSIAGDDGGVCLIWTVRWWSTAVLDCVLPISTSFSSSKVSDVSHDISFSDILFLNVSIQIWTWPIAKIFLLHFVFSVFLFFSFFQKQKTKNSPKYVIFGAEKWVGV